jgi:aminoglycoside phosphotransferase (APT) family kinase protein
MIVANDDQQTLAAEEKAVTGADSAPPHGAGPMVPDAGRPAGTDALVASLQRMGLARPGQPVALTALAGGVSSDIYRADLPDRSVCIKRALGKLKVAADWQAPVERNRYEVEWMRVAAEIVPAAVPPILGEDRDRGCFAMGYLDPDANPVWKSLLRDGAIAAETAAAVGDTLGRIHAATADRADIAARFATDDIFYAIRLEPYLVATGRAHADLAPRFADLVEVTRTTKRVLVHGDFSPKNILIGATGPVILDAECAWFGDPAFDLAFVLNHLLLKGAWRPAWRTEYVIAYSELVAAYFAHAVWEPRAALEARTAALLPGLMLARIDGKSPVEYLTADADRDAIRAFTRPLLVDPVASLAAIAARWLEQGTSR